MPVRSSITNEKSILFLGKRKDVETLVQQIDIGVLCTFTEGISNSVMEYMAAGKPVVVTNGGGSCELITDGVQGFLVPPAQPLAVAEKIELLAGDSVKDQQMGLAGGKRISHPSFLWRHQNLVAGFAARAVENAWYTACILAPVTLLKEHSRPAEGNIHGT